MVSIYPVDAIGWGCLVPGNGIPLSFCISHAGVSFSIDHRVLDGSDSVEIVKYLRGKLCV